MQQVLAIAQLLAFLGSVALLVVLIGTSIVALAVGKRAWARWALIGSAGLTGGYATALVGAGLLSADRLLPPNQAKVFCEIDCHVLFAVQTSSLIHTPSADAAHPLQQLSVSIQETFDASSISSRRGDGVLYPGTRRFRLVDSRGRGYAPVEVVKLSAAPLFAPMVPGESHRARLTFVLPAGVIARALAIESDDEVAPFLIGHERSPFHGRDLLSIGDPAVAQR